MKIILALSTLPLAACNMLPMGQPQPAGPYGPPQSGPYAPAQYRPGPPQAPCPITASRDWNAFVNAMPGPGTRPMLIVTGKVVTATAGYRIGFDPYLQLRERYPVQAFATMRVTPPTGVVNQPIVTHDVRWEWPAPRSLGSLEIRCGNETLATISPVQTAH